MNEIKLKACPFCGSEANQPEDVSVPNYGPWWQVMCSNEQCRAWRPGPSPAEAAHKWNTRAGDQQPKAGQNSGAKGQFAPCPGCAALVDWLKAEMDDDEIAKINARDHGEWPRYEHLEGHRTGLLHVLHRIRGAQHNVRMSDGGRET